MINKIFNCISIHNGGGITYLSMMHHEMDKKGTLIFLDYRAKKHIKPFVNAEIIFFKKNLFRNLFVFKERLKSSLIFRNYLKKNKKKEYFKEYFLNGIPPLFRFPTSSNTVFVLFQNKNLFSYLNYFDNKLFFNLNFIIYHLIHSFLINCFLKNSDVIIVQTHSMQKTIFSLKPKNIINIDNNYWKNLNLESYNSNVIKKNKNIVNQSLINKIKELSKNHILFFYPSSFQPHKNHKILIRAFLKCSLSSNKNIKLILTIEENQLPIKYRNNKHISCIGIQSINTINEFYKIADFLIFPSLNESLGLPLIEASFYKLPIIAPNLDYVYEVCKPNIIFDPYSEEDLFRKILGSTI